MTKKSVTYRDLRNTPGAVFERLKGGEPLTLMSEGEPRAILIPIEDGDVEGAIDAWRRGRALVSLAALQRAARASGKAGLTLDDINAEVKAVRAARRKRERPR